MCIASMDKDYNICAGCAEPVPSKVSLCKDCLKTCMRKDTSYESDEENKVIFRKEEVQRR